MSGSSRVPPGLLGDTSTNPVGWSSIYPPQRMSNQDPSFSPLVDRDTLTTQARLGLGLLGWRGPVTAAQLPAAEAKAQTLMDYGMAVAGATNPMVGTKPLVGWHGTRAAKPVVEFSQEAAEKTGRWTKDEAADIGFHFSPEREVAEAYGTPSKYHLSLENPRRITEEEVFDAQKRWLNDLEWSDNPADQNIVEFIKQTKAFDNPGSGFYNQGLKILADEAKAGGHDGLIFNRVSDFLDDSRIDEYIAFHPEQIKPAP